MFDNGYCANLPLKQSRQKDLKEVRVEMGFVLTVSRLGTVLQVEIISRKT